MLSRKARKHSSEELKTQDPSLAVRVFVKEHKPPWRSDPFFHTVAGAIVLVNGEQRGEINFIMDTAWLDENGIPSNLIEFVKEKVVKMAMDIKLRGKVQDFVASAMYRRITNQDRKIWGDLKEGWYFTTTPPSTEWVAIEDYGKKRKTRRTKREDKES